MPMIINKFEAIVNQYPGNTAIETMDETITYHNLNRKANCLARAIARQCANSENPAEKTNAVGIFLDHGIHQVAAVLAVLKARNLYVPFDTNYPEERLQWMIQDAGVKLIITQTKYIDTARKLLTDLPGGPCKIPLLDLEQLEDQNQLDEPDNGDGDTSPWENPTWNVAAPEEQLAYILYTSGSTGKPKGVPQTCRNVCFYTQGYVDMLGITPSDRVSYVCSFSHDAAVQDIFSALLTGAALCPLDIRGDYSVGDIPQWLMDKQVSRFHSVVTLFRYMADAVTQNMAFPHLKTIVIGGEKPHAEDGLLARKHFPGVQFGLIYGQSESSINSINFVDTSQKISKITLGMPIEGLDIMLLDDDGQEVANFQEGNIYIICPHLAPGYWQNPDATEDAFFYDEDLGPIYRTGDVGKMDFDGSIVFAGRKDGQVKIRGFRVELSEIERVLATHERIKDAAVTVIDPDAIEIQLCAYVVPSVPLSPDGATAPGSRELFDFLGQHLPDYMIPASFMLLDQMPLTPTGKVDRKSLPKPQLGAEEGAFIPPADHVEQELAQVWADVLDVPVDRIGRDSDFFVLGGHSLKAVSLTNALHKAFHVKLDLQEVFRATVLSHMARLIGLQEITPYMGIQPLEPQEHYELSYAQKRIWLLHQLNPGSAVFNMCGSARLGEKAEKNIVRKALLRLVQRHESFRTQFLEVGESVVQTVFPASPGNDGEARQSLPFEVVDFSDQAEGALEAKLEKMMEVERFTPFDLSIFPLFRMKLVKTAAPSADVIIFNMHHILSDGWSLNILFHDFAAIYQALQAGKNDSLPPLRIQYKDYAAWQNRALADADNMAQARAFWKDQLGGQLPQLKLPFDFSETQSHRQKSETNSGSGNPEHRRSPKAVQGGGPGGASPWPAGRPLGEPPEADGGFGETQSTTTDSAGYRFAVSNEITEKLRDLAAAKSASLFMVLLAAFYAFLHSLRDQEEIMVGIPGAARQHEDLKNVMGVFVNTLILKNRVDSAEPFDGFLQRVQEHTLKVLEFQGYPMEMICEDLKIKYPKLDVFFNMLNMGGSEKVDLTDFSKGHVEATQDTKFALALYITQLRNGISITCNYFTSLFKPQTIERLMEIYLRILNNITTDPSQPVARLHKSGEKRKLKRRK